MKYSPSKFYSVNELCELFRIQAGTAYAWNQQRKFTTYKIGGVLLFDAEEVNDIIENSKRRSMKALADKAKEKK